MTAALALAPAELVRVLRRTGGNVARTARALGVTGKAVRYALRRAGVSARAVRDFEPIAIVTPPPRLRRGRPLVRVLPVAGCDLAPTRGPLGTDNGSTCTGAPGAFGVPEVTEVVIRNVAVDVPVVTINAYREHWGQRQRRRAKVHRMIREALGVDWTPPELPPGWRWLVTFTRYALLRLDDDNATASFKPHRDAVSQALGLDDRDKRIGFRVCQAKWSERAMVKRWDRVTRRYELRPGWRSFFRIRVEQVRGDG